MSPKCPRCGLINFATATECKRCQEPLASGAYADNVWRDGKYLVVDRQGCTLPGRCMKCNSELKVSKWELQIRFYPLFSYFLIMLGAVVWTTYSVPAVFCSAHRGIALEGPKNTMLPNLLIIFGICALVLTVLSGFALMLLGLTIVLLGFGFLFYKLMQPSFKVKKRSKRFLWIKGVDQQYLSLLPQRR